MPRITDKHACDGSWDRNRNAQHTITPYIPRSTAIKPYTNSHLASPWKHSPRHGLWWAFAGGP
eukprot:4731444-Alexandrium_andersonii.AAC.1